MRRRARTERREADKRRGQNAQPAPRTVYVGVGAVMVALLAIVGWNVLSSDVGLETPANTSAAVREAAPPLELATLDGTFDLAAERGNTLLLFFSFEG